MTTTHLFVELLVIGFGSLVWLALLVLAIFGYPTTELADRLLSLQALFPLLSVAYVLGILIDRVADWLTESLDSKHRAAVFEENTEAYFDARRTLVVDGPALWAHIEYGRSRLRICRGWAINAILIALTLDAFSLAREPDALKPLWKLLLCNCFLLSLACLCAISWWKLNSKEYTKIERQANWIRNHPRTEE